jgi:hypothetical protein
MTRHGDAPRQYSWRSSELEKLTCAARASALDLGLHVAVDEPEGTESTE